jgi:hypothetical protein
MPGSWINSIEELGLNLLAQDKAGFLRAVIKVLNSVVCTVFFN